MILETKNGRGFCDNCDGYSDQLYYYKPSHITSTSTICTSCIPRCQNDDCEELALSEDHDFCDKCNEVIELEENA